MVIARRPKKENKSVNIDALINKGGSVAKIEGENKEKPLILRVPESLVERMDKAAKARRVKTPRNTWLIEAVLDKLDAEGF